MQRGPNVSDAGPKPALFCLQNRRQRWTSQRIDAPLFMISIKKAFVHNLYCLSSIHFHVCLTLLNQFSENGGSLPTDWADSGVGVNNEYLRKKTRERKRRLKVEHGEYGVSLCVEGG